MSGLLKRYGESVQMLSANDTVLRTVKGFVQALKMDDLEAFGSATPGGMAKREEYLLIAEPEAFAGAGEEKTVLWKSRYFTVMRAEKLESPAGAAHWEAILCPEGRKQL